MPTVSVITPTYNRAALVREAIESILAQTFADWEAVVVDDGSTDSTPEILRDYARRDPRIRVARQNNQGLTAARNHGLRLAQGEFIAFLDDDDLWLPEKLHVQVAFMRTHPQAALSYSRFYLLGSRNGGQPVYPKRPGMTYRELVQGNFIQVPTVMVRRNGLDAVGEFSPAYRGAQDFDLWLRIARRYPIGFIDQPLACYRKHGANMTAKLVPMYEERIAVLKTIRPDRRLGVTRALVHRQIAMYHYRMARLHLDGRDYREAAGQFLQAVWHDPFVGSAMRWEWQRGWRAAWRWLNPYLAIPYCWLRVVRYASR
ncbi:MAG: glycosyltransferase [Candidatus Omnitrophota bacterium]|nr:glycosyltransferase [Candidatus Omnitrophota bacterium]